MTFKPGDRVVRNRETWPYIDPSCPTVGLGVGVVTAETWWGRSFDEPSNAVSVNWSGVGSGHLRDKLLLATPDDEDGLNYSDPAVLRRAFVEDFVRTFGNPPPAWYVDHILQRYEARLKAMRGTDEA